MNLDAKAMLTLPFKHYSQKDSHPDWKVLNHEAARLAIQILRNITIWNFKEDLLYRKRKYLAILKTAKNLFKNKIKMARGNHDFIPIFYIWTMTNACNFICKYCSNHRGGKYPLLYKGGRRENLTTEQGKRLLEVMKESSAIYWCGGEPLLRKDLPELLRYSTKLNMFNMINSNGSLIGDLLLKPQYKDFLMQMDVFIISLDSLEIPKLSGMYNVNKGVARKVLRNILLLRILREYVPFKLVANTVITRDTVEDSFDILDWCNDLGITYSPVAMNIGNEPDWELIKNPQYQQLVTKTINRANEGYPMIASAKMLDRLLHAQIENCYPCVFDHVDYDGGIYWPCKSYPDAIKENVLKHKTVMQAHKAASKIIDPTNFHGKGKGKCNGDCQWMQDCVTETYATALAQGFFNSGILKEIGGLLG
ncbi:MAG: radical SAM protein [Candidatus Hodarchaeota archaeon]